MKLRMTLHSLRAFARTAALAATMVLMGTSISRAQQGDPTRPSSTITERMSAGPAAPLVTAPATKEVPVLDVRLGGLVLRNGDQGSVLLREASGRTHVIALRREHGAVLLQEFQVAGVKVTVVDFSHDCVTLRRSDTGETVTVR